MTRNWLGLLALLGAAVQFEACGPVSSAPPSEPPPDASVTSAHRVLRLVTVVPLPDQDPIGEVAISRRYTQTSTLDLDSGWQTMKMSTFVGSGRIIARHRSVQFEFGVTPLNLRSTDPTDEAGVSSSPLALGVLVRNASSSGVQIDWNAVMIFGVQGDVLPVIHRGIKLARRSASMPPSTIPPAAILDDLVCPRELIAPSTWRGSGWLGVNYFESLSPGQRFTLNLPVRLGTEAVEYQFTFEVAAPSDHATLISRRTSAAPSASARSLPRATSRVSGTIPQLVHG
jgi:hypothetical protein